MLNIVVAFALGLLSSTLLARSSHRFGRELDTAGRLAAAYRRALHHLRAYRHASMGAGYAPAVASDSLAAYRQAALDVEVEWATLEMLLGPLGVPQAHSELLTCAERIEGLAVHFEQPGYEERRLAFDDTQTAVQEIEPKLVRVERFLDVLIATYRDRTSVLPWFSRRRRTAIGRAVIEMGVTPQAGYVTDLPDRTPLP